ncbi:hypothetical protein KJ652_07215 [Patescibacteria group bacterium]|nr:hypothetical protein [Patescibacteria group bacterium]MBU1124339.1 hypothetical protein [Patescibacteria group bacterium]MBU1911217.1 hypothetical protein [Patescibacteria group bacterium]
MVQTTCPQCSASFEVTKDDLALYDKVSPVINGEKYQIPPPSICPDCRQQRRLAYRNERNFYQRTCDKTGSICVSVYSPDKPCTVYDQTVWWSDDWDQLATGREYDFSKSFFEQHYELSKVAPRPCILNMSSENAKFTNHSAYNKNCYMCINTGYCEDCYYLSNFSPEDKDCMDCMAIQNCELCYYCIDTKKSHSSSYLHWCIDCTDCHFCEDCHSCQNCFGCWNLRHKKYCIFNKQYSPEKYKEEIEKIKPHDWSSTVDFLNDFQDKVKKEAVFKYASIENYDNATGDYIYGSKNIKKSYNIIECEDLSYCYDCGDIKFCIDTIEPYHGELQHESHGCNLGYALNACSKCYECNNLLYSQYCWYCKDCFGCFGIRNKQYCILNKQYSKNEYYELVPKIIEKMIADKDWGEFFPIRLSLFAYNETAAQQYYPLTKDEIENKGWNWIEENNDIPEVEKTIPANQLPDSIEDIPDDILNWAIKCDITNRPFRIVPQELDFYRRMKLPIPHLHPDERHKQRMKLRNPRKLWKRKCDKCEKDIQTSYDPERPESVLCEECYLKEVY